MLRPTFNMARKRPATKHNSQHMLTSLVCLIYSNDNIGDAQSKIWGWGSFPFFLSLIPSFFLCPKRPQDFSSVTILTSKISPFGTDGRPLLQARRRSDEHFFSEGHISIFFPSSKSRDKTTGETSKIRPDQI